MHTNILPQALIKFTHLDSNLIAKLRLTKSPWIRTYKFYYFYSFSTLAKSLSSFWRRCRGTVESFQLGNFVII